MKQHQDRAGAWLCISVLGKASEEAFGSRFGVRIILFYTQPWRQNVV